MTGEYYANVLHRLKKKIKTKRRGKLTKGVLLLHEIALVYKDKISAMTSGSFKEMVHPLYSSD